jgi:putative tryptophan/tyrosine transport system substrate-binding protein
MRKVLATLLVLSAFYATEGEASAAQKLHILGYLGEDSLSSTDIGALQKMLRQLGYIDGQTVAIETRFAGGRIERLDDLARDLIQKNVELLVAQGLSAGQAARRQDRKIPIVVVSRTEPIRPGGNVTGATNLSVELSAARLQILKEIQPRISRVAVLWYEASPIASSYLKKIKETAKSSGMEIESHKLKKTSEIEAAFQAVAAERGEGVLVEPQALFAAHLGEIAGFGLKGRLAVVSGVEEFAEAGGLVSYGLSIDQMWRHTAVLIDKILRRRKLKNGQFAELPVEQPNKFELAINLKTARQIGIAVPREMLARADKVIQ